MAKKSVSYSSRIPTRKSVVTAPRQTMDIGRNDPCPCGSGKKFKQCCVEKGDHWLRKMAAKEARAKAKEEQKKTKKKFILF